MVVHALKSTAVRGARAATSKRCMGGSAAPAPEWTGIDAVVRKVLPQDDQLAGAILAGYGVLIMGATIGSKMGGSAPAEEPAPVAPVTPAASTGSIPSVDSDEFATFIESEENLLKWIETAEK
uniref:Uncharacterized protein n=1 Tax=Helicotheca tamesis TaxID=374047 RepID=A0A7S2I9N5_9STRA|mmetsp:Transcript_6999/g.9463  ORF Transcript_6999/g.9463 Transcript_6999/m.9463 type:complete len:123 (+) Transcript_6999:89-457(+)|eukprot:CAMPEP_0185723788 /NCGR_PEP_ID=MMETSP1171-20130828/510_1 /TAXON_ID=374046 /ORGANISM="Helicotheca tamensis, Strain CCMP826" /LENGTH=122 /DNA_ID=CAMNT_0028391541 /DNA_START=64 /DNA_END=432 /DNA_ORIENTATION=-